MTIQEQFDSYILELRRLTDREITTKSLEYAALQHAYIQGRLDALKEIQQEQQSIIFNDLNERVGL